MTILTLSGKAESGKDKTAKMIAEELELMGYQVLICHFADLLKYICKQYFGWDGKKNEEGRSLLQIVGTDTIRKQDEGFWVDFIKSILRFFPDEWDFVIISDCRFPNEILSFNPREPHHHQSEKGGRPESQARHRPPHRLPAQSGSLLLHGGKEFLGRQSAEPGRRLDSREGKGDR